MIMSRLAFPADIGRKPALQARESRQRLHAGESQQRLHVGESRLLLCRWRDTG